MTRRNTLSNLTVVVIAFAMAFFAATARADSQTFVVSVAGEKRLDVYSINEQGQVSLQSKTATRNMPGTSRFDPTSRNLYVGTKNTNGISVFRFDSSGLTHLQSVDAPAKPAYLQISPNGQFLVSAYYATGQVTVHRILGEGRLSSQPQQTITTAPHAHCVTFDKTGAYVFVAHTTPSNISQFRMDPESGTLTANDPALLQCEDNIGPRHLKFHPTENFVYSSDEQGRSISQYAFQPTTGTLRHRQTRTSIPKTFTGKGTSSAVHIHPSGRYAYMSNRGHATISVFNIDLKSGSLSLLQHVPSAETVRSFNLSPDGRLLVAACQRTGVLITYKIADDGQLQQVSNQPTGKSPWWIAFPTATSTTKTPTSVSESEDHHDRSLALGQGTMSGEVTSTTILLQTRLTQGTALNAAGDIPGSAGVVSFQWSTEKDFSRARQTTFRSAESQTDFIVREQLTQLQPNTTYYYRTIYGSTATETSTGPTCSFRTLPGADGSGNVKFIVASCMNYIKFMHGRQGNARGPLTATAEDKRLGFPAFAAMRKHHPAFFVGTGDIVYYDNPFRVAKTTEELRRCWHEQFRFPRMIDFFRDVPAFWSKDDHDFRYNDSDNETDRTPLPSTGIDLFHEQLPIAAAGSDNPKTYRTIRVSHDLQIWLTEGRDYRSPNQSPDGPEKSMWGKTQRDWIKTTLAASDAKWKLLISPTPMVGPDDGYKHDNHANLQGFRHEADEFFEWVQTRQIDNLFLFCGDRHWQYHSIHPSGIHEFACGALNDENSRMGVPPGAEYGSDPEGKVKQPYTSPEPSGGFMEIEAGDTLTVDFYNDESTKLYGVKFPQQPVSRRR